MDFGSVFFRSSTRDQISVASLHQINATTGQVDKLPGEKPHDEGCRDRSPALDEGGAADSFRPPFNSKIDDFAGSVPSAGGNSGRKGRGDRLVQHRRKGQSGRASRRERGCKYG